MKTCSCALIPLLIVLCLACPAAADDVLPTKENPLVIDRAGRRVLIYTEVNERGLTEANPHWGVVSKDGKLRDYGILLAYANHLEFHDALVEIGATPGDNLTEDTLDEPVRGDAIEVTATWPGLGRELGLEEIFGDKAGEGFDIRFGGNRRAAEVENTGCVTCLESCWVSITSNAKYPNISNWKRTLMPNSKFWGNRDALPGGGKPVILIYRLV